MFLRLQTILRGEGLIAGLERFSEFANILFLKLLSENGKESYWEFIKKLPNDRLIRTINDSVIKEIENKYGGDVFTPILIKNPKTLRKIIEMVNPLILSTIDTDIKGDAFEYFLKQTTSAKNDLGQYFTPRHIVKTIINLIAPRFKEKVYDPFCGTGGFLTEAFKYIKENGIIDQEDLGKLKQESLCGGEISVMARIAKMNMILQGDGHSGIKHADSLSVPIDGQYDIVMTNIPFSQITDYSSLYYNGIAKNNVDSICILHCLRALKKGGRMAIIVSEGFLFRKDIKRIREFLLSQIRLQCIISLPQGVFLPYTNSKTNILYFTNAHQNNQQKSCWYFEVKNDGYSLNNHRKPLEGRNDLYKIDELDLRKLEKEQSLSKNLLASGFELMDLDKVKKNDYNLVGSFYRDTQQDIKYKLVKLGDVVEILNGYAFKSKNYTKKGIMIIRITNVQKGKITDDNPKFYPSESLEKYKKFMLREGDILISLTGHVGRVGLLPSSLLPAVLNQRVACLRTKSDNQINKKYLFAPLNSDIFENLCIKSSLGIAQKNLSTVQLANLKILIPPIEEQQEIVEQLEAERKMIESQKDIIATFEKKMQNRLNNLWQLEEKPKSNASQSEPVADQSVFDLLNNKASKPSQ